MHKYLIKTRSTLKILLYVSRSRYMFKQISLQIFLERETKLLKHVSNRNRERFNLEVKKRENRRQLQAWESFEPWSLFVESQGTMFLGSARKLEESNKIN